MTYGGALVAVACFAAALEGLGILGIARRAMRTSLESARTLRDSNLSDEQKERAARMASLTLLRSFAAIALRTAAAVGAFLLAVAVLDRAGVARAGEVNRFLVSGPGLALGSVTVVLVHLAWTRR